MPTQMPQSQPHLKNLLPPPPIRPLQNHPTSQLLTQPPPGQFVLQGGVLQQNQPRLLLPNQTPNTALPPPSLNQPPPQLPMQPPVIVRQPFQGFQFYLFILFIEHQIKEFIDFLKKSKAVIFSKYGFIIKH